jgi:helix-turn-helix protein
MRRVKVEVEFAIVPIWLITADISAQAVRIYAVLARLAYRSSRTPTPSYKELAETVRCSLATARRAVGELATLGAIEVEKRVDGRGQDSNGYVVKVSRPLLIGEQAGLFTDEQAPRSQVSTPKEQEKELIGENPILPQDAEILCLLLAELIEGNGSKRPPITQQWRDEARRLLDRDHRDPHEAERVMRWCQADPFWRSNVLSMPKFRQRYDQLRLRMEQPNDHRPRYEGVLDRMAREVVEGVNGDNRTDQGAGAPPVRSLPR